MHIERRLSLTLLALVSLALSGCDGDVTRSPSNRASEDGDTFAETHLVGESGREVQAVIDRMEALSATLAASHRHPHGGVVFLPAGSVDALEAVIQQAGEGGLVIVEPGMHMESGTVTVPFRVTIYGQPGSTLQVDTRALVDGATAVDAALYVVGAARTAIWGLEIVPTEPLGGTAILLEDSPMSVVARCTLSDHEYGVVLEQADRSTIYGNTIAIGPNGSHGVTIVNAKRTFVVANEVSNALFGIWACDLDGRLFFNEIHDSYIGIILCKVPAEIPLPSGGIAGSEFSGTSWVVQGNDAHENFDANYLVIDGANHNLLVDNRSSNPGTYDYELVGDSYRFGFLTPTSFENRLVVRDAEDTAKDCGIDNIVIGGVPIDTDADPCF